MKLLDNWKTIVTKAWSARLMILAGVLSGLEVAFSFVASTSTRGVFAALASITAAAAFVARLVAQKDITK